MSAASKGRQVLLATGLFLALATIVPPPPLAPLDGPATAALTATPIRLDEGDPRRRRVGRLVFLGGWVLRSDEPRFGGISAMQIADAHVVALSDSGVLLRFPLPPGVGGTARLDIIPLARPWQRRDLGFDTEALILGPDAAWLGIERRHAAARFSRPDWRLESLFRPVAMRSWRRNSGTEAMVLLDDGRFMLFAERKGISPVLLFAGDPAEPGTSLSPLRYRPSPGYRVTDAARLPDGRLLLLHRRVVWFGRFSARLSVVDARKLRAGMLLHGNEIATLEWPLAVDNFEALSVTRENGRTIVRLASDNNFTTVQRTLLLEFALADSD